MTLPRGRLGRQGNGKAVVSTGCVTQSVGDNACDQHRNKNGARRSPLPSWRRSLILARLINRPFLTEPVTEPFRRGRHRRKCRLLPTR